MMSNGIRPAGAVGGLAGQEVAMRYVEFRDAIGKELRRVPSGLTWAALKSRLKLPYSTPCPEWLKQMEQDIGLSRERGSGRAFTWKISPATAAKVPPSGPRARLKSANRTLHVAHGRADV
jgi:hypothetical protein